MVNKAVLLVSAVGIVIVTTICALVVTLVPSDAPVKDNGDVQPIRTCAHRQFDEESTVCVCNSTYCDVVPDTPTLGKKQIFAYTSSKKGLRFATRTLDFQELTTSTQLPPLNFTIDRSTATLYQKIIGFGGSFTDAAGINILSLSKKVQENLLKSYFSPEGLQYNVGRVPMGGCDFSTRLYTYADVPEDYAMEHFELAHEDFNFKIPLMKRAMEMNSRNMKFIGSPWSAPSWMKTNGALYGGGFLKGEAGDKYHKAWALYFTRFVEAYKRNGIEMWGLTAQNEPIDGFAEDFAFNCMGFTAEEQRDFVKTDLGPALHERGHGHLKLMIGDDQRPLFPAWAETVIGDPDAAKYISGIGVHWYMDMLAPPTRLSETHDLFPDVFILGTEACTGAIPFVPDKVQLGNWERGQRYSIDIIQDLNHWVAGWVDWNLALDQGGGPNWANNFVDAPIIVNQDEDEFYKQPMFYHMGHFSKFIPEGSMRIEMTGPSDRRIKYVAFLHEDKTTVSLVLLNIADEGYQGAIVDANLGYVKVDLPANSIQTLMWNTV